MKERVVAEDYFFLYPALGDPTPPPGAQVHLLTHGGVCVRGVWNPTQFLAWAPLPRRNHAREALLNQKDTP